MLPEPADEELVTSQEAARRLGVKPATIYAYVSRGLLPRLRGRDGRSRFAVADLDEIRRGPLPGSLAMRAETVRSGLTTVRDGALLYRGADAAELARSTTFETAAEWLWTGARGDPVAWEPEPSALAVGRAVQRALPPDSLPLDRLRVGAAAIAVTDPLRYELGAPAVILTARQLVATLVESLPPAAGSLAPVAGQGIAARLWSKLAPGPPGAGLGRATDAALVLLLDHDLSLSTLAARMAASLGADPYSVVSVGLGALGAPLHAVASLAAEDLLTEIESPGQAAAAVGDRLRRGDRLPGFGHRLHRRGDPRARLLLQLVRECGVDQGGHWEVVEQVLAVTASRGLPPPNIDFALAALTSVAEMTRGSSEAIFAVARSAGWLAHAINAYAASAGAGAARGRSPSGPER